jgi:hypothetical protein
VLQAGERDGVGFQKHACIVSGEATISKARNADRRGLRRDAQACRLD